MSKWRLGDPPYYRKQMLESLRHWPDRSWYHTAEWKLKMPMGELVVHAEGEKWCGYLFMSQRVGCSGCGARVPREVAVQFALLSPRQGLT